MHLHTTQLSRTGSRLDLAFNPERLRRLRIKRRLTQQQIADLLGIAVQNYGVYERGRYAPKEQRLRQLAEILETTEDYLLGRTDDPAQVTKENLSADERELLRAYRSGDLQALNRLFLNKAREGKKK